ncbi:serine hydrolase domain-containing protein [Streptomyces sp. NPDC051578]|uniref:serine hydrolase domain-containing protein n=1 Tax=Streptomyces sp. NPDC051578 TaxID=3365662 RepID=UPI0037AC02F8
MPERRLIRGGHSQTARRFSRRARARAIGCGLAACGLFTATVCVESQAAALEVRGAPASFISQFSPSDIAKIDAAAGQSLGHQITGVVVSVSDPARGTLLKAYGKAAAGGRRMTPDVHYRTASVTKALTAQAILRLGDQGKLSLSDTIRKYVADFPNGSKITLHDLLGMRGGVYNYTDDAQFLGQYAKNPLWPGWTPDDAVKIMKRHAEDFRPHGTKTVYSDSEYILLGVVIQKVTGQPADVYISRTIQDLGLKNTTFPATDVNLPRPYSNGYWYTPPAGSPLPLCPTAGPSTNSPSPSGSDCHVDMTRGNPQVPWTAGAVVSTVSDMTRLAPELATGAGLKPATAKERQEWTSMSNPGSDVPLEYGLGLMRIGDWIGHDGAIFGYSTMVFYLPSRKSSVVVMANASNAESVTALDLWGKVVTQLYPDTLSGRR